MVEIDITTAAIVSVLVVLALCGVAISIVVHKPKEHTTQPIESAQQAASKAKPKKKRTKSKAKKVTSISSPALLTISETKTAPKTDLTEEEESEEEEEIPITKKKETSKVPIPASVRFEAVEKQEEIPVTAKKSKAVPPGATKKSKTITISQVAPNQLQQEVDDLDDIPDLSNEASIPPSVAIVPSVTPASSTFSDSANSPPVFDGWAVVEDRRKGKALKKPDAEEERVSPVPQTPVEVGSVPALGPVVETITQEFIVDSKKLGLLIGPKGITKIGIQNITGTTINMPKFDKLATAPPTGPVTIVVSGPALGVQKAINALHELNTKGYATALEADDFQESYVAVHHKYLPDIIGKGGASVRALQQHTGVKITIPNTAKAPGPDGKVPKVKIGLAGRKEKVGLARSLIKDLTKYHHTPITHPGVTHLELDIPNQYYNFIIGSKGSEIKHIQNSYKVAVHIPNEDSANSNVVIVGEESAVAHAERHITKIIDRVSGAAAAATAAAEQAAQDQQAASQQPNNGTDEIAADETSAAATETSPVITAVTTGGHVGWANAGRRIPTAPTVAPAATEESSENEAWMSEFVPKTTELDLSTILPPGAKFSATPPVSNTTTASSNVALNGPRPTPAASATSSTVVENNTKKGAWNNLSGLNSETW